MKIAPTVATIQIMEPFAVEIYYYKMQKWGKNAQEKGKDEVFGYKS